MAKPQGLRTLYLDKAWFSCRAGAYDNWEWRSGDSSSVSLTPSFNNYLCWEMNEWIRRDIWDAVYLDECYEHPARNLEAGFSVRLPDGSEQPGVTNFRFRELMKRWRTIFVQSGKEPFLISHLTGSWQYHGVVFCDSYLDGENHPIVSLNSRDWIDSTSRPQFEMVQNARLWGVSSFYMPFVSEGGFGNKMKSQFPRWQWRMARQAQSQFAHYETSTVYEGQGSQVYKSYWNDVLGWGAGTVSAASFHPYWDNAKAVQVEGQGGDVLVSYYKGDGRILLIASNRRKTDQTMRIALDLAALGLKANPSATARDSSFDPPSGEDYLGSKAVQEEARKMFESGGTIALGEEPDDKLLDAELEGPDELKARAEQWTARLEGNVLVLPVRARDFRLVAIE